MDLRAWNPDVFIEFEALLEPVICELHAVFWSAEILDLHLLEFPRAEDVVARIDFVSKSFSDLSDAEWELLARSIQNIAKVHKDGLSRLGA